MGSGSKIEWCDASFNPWVGCTKISPACDNCYAESWAKRSGLVKWGDNPRRRTSTANWNQPLRWNTDAARRGERLRVFCASLADVFDNEVPVEWRRDLCGLIERTPNLTWLLLTKRIGNVARLISEARSHDWLMRENVMLGATICNQDEADRDIRKLIEAPARRRFLSIEPILEDINLPRVDFHCDLCGGTGILARFPKGQCYFCMGGGYISAISSDPKFGMPSTPMRRIDWIIVGGESGHRARPTTIGAIRSIVSQCRRASTPVFVKQLGSRPVNREGVPHKISDRAGGLMGEFPDDLRIREIAR